MAHKSYEK